MEEKLLWLIGIFQIFRIRSKNIRDFKSFSHRSILLIHQPLEQPALKFAQIFARGLC